MYTIVRREAFSDTTFLWEVMVPDVAKSAQPGHFVMVRLHEGGERIPLTVADFDRDKGTITMVIQALGKTTIEMRDHYKEGDSFADFVGPLGKPQHLSKAGHVVLVGGGLGVAPVYPQLRAFKETGNRTTGIIGFRNKDLVFWEDRFRKHCDNLIVCTDDGSYGTPGFVTAALQQILETDKPDLVVAIGPLPMMNACVETTRPFGVKTMVSLNAIMVDGTGMCGSCRVSVGGEVKFACVDGPDFDGHVVDFKELILRQRRFKGEESRASEDYAHVCQVEKTLFEENKRNYKKYKDLAPLAVKMPERDALERSRNFKEVNLGYSMHDALEEAERCIMCSKPVCIAGCPVSIDIPRFIRHLLVRDLDGALGVINEANLFPSVCGRVCPQESQCEAQCIIGKNKKLPMEPVAIGRLERFIGDNAHAPKAVPPQFARTLGRVGIVGSGPSGLAVAADLVRYGCEVTVFEALHVVGGVLQYGIPSFRLPRDIISREVENLKGMGVKFETNKVIGKTFSIPQLMGEMGYDAVFVGAGAGAPSFLGIPGEFAGQVYSANEFLTRINLMGGDKFPYLDTPITLGKSVVVIGAGNTAMDCLRVAKRLGTPTVRCVYRRSEAEAPARIEELRHAKEEGIDFFFLHTPVEIITGDEGIVRGMKVQKMMLGEPDEKGRRKPLPLDEFVELECDTVIYALGTKAKGDLLPVSAMPVDGTFPTGTTQWEKRSIAQEIPIWDAAICTQCAICPLVCPHAAIRMNVYPSELLKGAPAGFKSVPWRGKEGDPYQGWSYTLQVAPEDCTGCGICVDVCPSRSKEAVKHKAINMEAKLEHLEVERASYDFFLGLPEVRPAFDKIDLLKGSQLRQPLFEYSGACSGCGETPYLKLISQLYGDHLLIANATGCSSIYGGNLPTTPYSQNVAGQGPAWANSLFEDNAEFGLGMRLAVDAQRDLAHKLVRELRADIGDALATALLDAPQDDDEQILQQRERVKQLKAILSKLGNAPAAQLLAVADSLVVRSVWIVGGDGWAYDIGYGGLDHVLASGRNINILVLDTEVYSNTGGQASKATPRGAVAKFAAAGKSTGKKDLGMIAMAYGNVYVAQVAMGANPIQTVRTFREAAAWPGPSLIIAYSHCIAHGIDMTTGMSHQRDAVKSGYLTLYHYDPRLGMHGADQPLKLDSRKPTVPLEQFTMKEGRFAMLAQADPARAKMLGKVAQTAADARWLLYEQIAGVHRNVTDDNEPADSGGGAAPPAPAANPKEVES